MIEDRDTDAMPGLVDCLEDREPEIRMLAFIALKKITGGRTMGWHYAAAPDIRAAAVKRWRAWLKAGMPKDWKDASGTGAGAP